MPTIGILALQGGVEPHANALANAGLSQRRVRKVADFVGIDGLILPGGESPTQWRLLSRLEMIEPLRNAAASLPVLATCAGMILLARSVVGPRQPSLGAIDIEVVRNGWGRQHESFEATTDRGRPALFIRAPRIREKSDRVQVVDSLRGEPVLVKSGQIWAATFHPELTNDHSLHYEIFCGSRN